MPQTLTFVHGEVSVNGHNVYLLKQLKQKVGHWTNSMWGRPEHLGSLLLVPYRCGLKLVNFLELSSLPFVGCRLSSCLNLPSTRHGACFRLSGQHKQWETRAYRFYLGRFSSL